MSAFCVFCYFGSFSYFKVTYITPGGTQAIVITNCTILFSAVRLNCHLRSICRLGPAEEHIHHKRVHIVRRTAYDNLHGLFRNDTLAAHIIVNVRLLKGTQLLHQSFALLVGTDYTDLALVDKLGQFEVALSSQVFIFGSVVGLTSAVKFFNARQETLQIATNTVGIDYRV